MGFRGVGVGLKSSEWRYVCGREEERELSVYTSVGVVSVTVCMYVCVFMVNVTVSYVPV